jgi:hypothetical protein
VALRLRGQVPSRQREETQSVKVVIRTVRFTPIRALLCLLCLLWPSGAAAGGAHPNAGTNGWVTLIGTPNVRQPTGLAIDLRGNHKTAKWAYVADAYSRRIVKFGTNGTILGSWPFGLAKDRGAPAAVAVGGSGNVFVADSAEGTVRKYSPTGSVMGGWSGFSQPRSLVVFPTGAMYIAETGAHRITELSPAGKVVARWDTYAGFLQEYTVPYTTTESVGTPIALALDAPDSLFMGTRCVVGQTCGHAIPTEPHQDLMDGLYNLRVQGKFRRYVGDWWFGLPHAANDTPQSSPYKEAEPFVTIDSLASNRPGHGYVAGMLWPLGGKAGRGVIGYSSLGSKFGYWPLPAQSRVMGVAVDGLGGIYVSQGNHILKYAHPPHNNLPI